MFTMPGRERGSARGQEREVVDMGRIRIGDRSRHVTRRVALLSAGVILALLGIVLTGAGDVRAADPQAWFTYSRPAVYSAVYSLIQVPMRDGAVLTCDLMRPGQGTAGQFDPSGTPTAGRFPGIIISYSVYVAENAATFESNAAPLAEVGYVVMNCDPRGLARTLVSTPGQIWQSPYAAIEAQDNYDMIEWLAAQPFSTGKVGQTGESYAAMTADRVAELRPPHLAAILPLSSTYSQYSDSKYKGGAFGAAGPTWASLAFALSGGEVNPAVVVTQFEQHPLYDAYWKQIDAQTNYANLVVPRLELGGWTDSAFPSDALGSYAALRSHIDPQNPASTGSSVIVGPWGHAGSPTCSPTPACGVALAWWDRYLYGLQSAPAPPARVEVFQMPQSGGQGWQDFNDWPPPDVSTMSFDLNNDLQMSTVGGVPGSNSYTVSSTDNATAGTPAEATSQRLIFTSAALPNDLDVAGFPQLTLRASISASDAIFVAQLNDVAPDGTITATSAAPWYLKASHRLSNESLTAIAPGVMADYTIAGWGMSWRFQKGHHIQLKIASAADVYPVANPYPTTLVEVPPSGTVSLATGLGGTHLDLPVRAAPPANVPDLGQGVPGVGGPVIAIGLAAGAAALLRRRRHSRASAAPSRSR
jgi:predicted acyl esterase